jgi:hypothetical protein
MISTAAHNQDLRDALNEFERNNRALNAFE